LPVELWLQAGDASAARRPTPLKSIGGRNDFGMIGMPQYGPAGVPPM